MNLNLKNKIAKISAQTGLNWVAALPIALMIIRCCVNQSTGFTPYELLTGRQFPGPWTTVPAEESIKSNRKHAECWKELKALVSSFTQQVGVGVNAAVPDAKAVWLKVSKRKWRDPRWTGPFEETARTTSAVRLKGKGETWFHWSQCAVADESLLEISSTQSNTRGEHRGRIILSPCAAVLPSSLPGETKKEEEHHVPSSNSFQAHDRLGL